MENQEDNQYEMPIPSYAMGIRILLVDPDIASLMHTTSVLEEATYQVTSTELPDIALSMMQERVNEYDLVMAAVNMRGMDCLTFLQRLTILSDIPVILLSYKTDVDLAMRTLRQGACHYLEKPIPRDDVRGLWQYVFRKRRKRTYIEAAMGDHPEEEETRYVEKMVHEKTRYPENDPKDKGKQVMEENGKETRKRRRIYDYDGNKENDKSSAQASNCANRDPKNMEKEKNKKEKSIGKDKKKHAKWNSELHAKFMKVLTKDEQGNARRAQKASSQPDVTMSPQAASHLQNFKQQLNCPDTNTATPTSTSDTSEGQPQPQPRPQVECRAVVAGFTPDFLGQNNKPKVRKTSNGGLNFPNLETSTATQRLSLNPRTQLAGTGGLNLGMQINLTGTTNSERFMIRTTANNPFGFKEIENQNLNRFGSGVGLSNLKGRIDQIRNAYKTSTLPGKTSTLSNTEAQETDDSNQHGNQVPDAIRAITVESFFSCGKINHSQYENVSNGDLGTTSNVLGANMVQTYDHNGLTSFMNLGFSPSLNVCLPDPILNTMEVSCITPEIYAPSFLQNACNLQTDPTMSFQAPNHPISSTNNYKVLASEETPTSTSNSNQELDVVNQAEKPTNDLGGKILEELGDINPSDGLQKNTGFPQQPTNDDFFMEEILAEFRNDFADGDLKTLGFNTSNVM